MAHHTVLRAYALAAEHARRAELDLGVARADMAKHAEQVERHVRETGPCFCRFNGTQWVGVLTWQDDHVVFTLARPFDPDIDGAWPEPEGRRV